MQIKPPFLLCSVLPKEGTIVGFFFSENWSVIWPQQLQMIKKKKKKDIQVLEYCNETYKQFKNT